MKTIVLSVGGSVVVQDTVNVRFLQEFAALILARRERLIIVVGGGGVCRMYQRAAAEITSVTDRDKDWIGIAATHLNAQLVRSVLARDAYEYVIINPTVKINTPKRILVAGGWKPGHSTDTDAVELALLYDAQTILNITNVDYLYDSDPHVNKHAKKIERASWAELQKLVGKKWSPGLHAPFDPVATQRAAKAGLQLFLLGADVHNIKKALDGSKFIGTVVD